MTPTWEISLTFVLVTFGYYGGGEGRGTSEVNHYNPLRPTPRPQLRSDQSHQTFLSLPLSHSCSPGLVMGLKSGREEIGSQTVNKLNMVPSHH